MSELTPCTPQRPLYFNGFVCELKERLSAKSQDIYLVGGVVRDCYLKRNSKDIDLAINHNAIGLARQIADEFSGDIYVMDRERDVTRVFVEFQSEKYVIDLARFRGDSLLADLQDRDFTINAMAVDLKSDLDTIIDPLNGETDCINRYLRRCSATSISNDPLRALRAVRQSVQFGMRIEPETLQDIRQYANDIQLVSPERVRDEWFALLSLEKVASAVRISEKVGILPVIFPELVRTINDDHWEQSLKVMEEFVQMLIAIGPKRTDDTAARFGLGMLTIQLDRYRSQLQTHLAQTWANERSYQAFLMLSALLHQADLPTVEAVSDSLKLSNPEKQRLLTLVDNYPVVLEQQDWSVVDVHRFWYRLKSGAIDVCLLALAHHLGAAGTELEQASWLKLVERVRSLLEAYFEHYDTIVEPKVVINGNHLMESFDISGRVIGELLTSIREAQVAGEVQSLDDALELADKLLQT